MSLNWRDSKKELPKEGEIVWVIYQHWKEHNPRSCQIFCGEVQYNNSGKDPRVQTDDFTGSGAWAVYFNGEQVSEDRALAWIPASEFKMPEWIPHDKHWGEKL